MKSPENGQEGLFNETVAPAGSMLYRDEDQNRREFFESYPGQERAEKERILLALAERRKKYLAHIRRRMESLYLWRHSIDQSNAYVSADDARKVCEDIPDIPPPEIMSRAFLGSVFKTKEWMPVTAFGEAGPFVASTQKGNHARLHYCWRLKPEYLPDG